MRSLDAQATDIADTVIIITEVDDDDVNSIAIRKRQKLNNGQTVEFTLVPSQSSNMQRIKTLPLLKKHLGYSIVGVHKRRRL